MKFNKLVRDRIPEIIERKGDKAITHIANDDEYTEALTQKLHEEVDEFLKEPSVEEAADILEVLRAICDLKDIDLKDLEEVRQGKAEKRGGFRQRIILDETN